MALVLITGGAGFIGSYVSQELLARGHRLRILDPLSPQIHGSMPRGLTWLDDERIDFRRGSVTNASDVKGALTDAEVVVHLAAETGTGQSMYEIERYNAVNVGGTAQLLDVLTNDPSRTVKRVVLASSRSIYGEGAYVCTACSPSHRVNPDSRTAGQLAAHRWEHVCAACGADLSPVPTSEYDPPKPASVYAATKYAQEDLVRIVCGALSVDHAILRLQNVYGEGQSLNNPYTGILSIFSTRIRRGQNLPIFEDGLETRDFVHVQDVAKAFAAAVDHATPIARSLNVGAGIKTTVKDIAGALSDAFGAPRDLVTTHQYRLGDIRHNFADTSSLESVLGYRAQISLQHGLRRFADWVSSQPLPEDRLDAANAELKARNLMG